MVRRKKKPKTSQRIVVIILVVAVVAAAVLAFLYRDSLTGSVGETGDGSAEPYVYEYGVNQQFALMGSHLAISSTTGLQLLDQNGYPLIRQVFSMKNPAVSVGDKHCVFYDIGGTALRLYSGGEIFTLDTGGNIISVSMCRSGYFAVSCEESRYKGAVVVYDSSGELAYKWYSGSGYVLDAALSPDGSRLAVLCLEASGSVVHLFELKSDEEIGAVFLPRELAFKLSFSGNNSFRVLSESALHFFNTAGEELSVTNFEGMTLMDFLFTENVCVLSLGKYVTGDTVTLSSYSPEGKLLGTAEISPAPLTLSAARQRIFALKSGEAMVLSNDLSVLSKTEIPAGYSKAVYLPNGSCLLLSSYRGEKISVR